MTASHVPPIPRFELTEEQLQKISGGDMCSAEDWQNIFNNLTNYYEALVGFTSYVFERVIVSTN
jgi:bacteriocin-like protein